MYMYSNTSLSLSRSLSLSLSIYIYIVADTLLLTCSSDPADLMQRSITRTHALQASLYHAQHSRRFAGYGSLSLSLSLCIYIYI